MYLVLNRNNLLVPDRKVYFSFFFLKNVKIVILIFKDTCKKKNQVFKNHIPLQQVQYLSQQLEILQTSKMD